MSLILLAIISALCIIILSLTDDRLAILTANESKLIRGSNSYLVMKIDNSVDANVAAFNANSIMNNHFDQSSC
jgi:hypothetical protein